MKLVCSKSNLLNGVNIVSKAVPNRTTMSILECILIDASGSSIKLIANDTELGIETIVEGATYKIPTYKVTENGIEDGEGIEIKFCKGNKENPDTLRQEGIFTETLLQVGLQYLQSVNVGELASRDTSLAITHLEDALFRIGKRAEDRKLRGVQATYNK